MAGQPGGRCFAFALNTGALAIVLAIDVDAVLPLPVAAVANDLLVLPFKRATDGGDCDSWRRRASVLFLRVLHSVAALAHERRNRPS